MCVPSSKITWCDHTHIAQTYNLLHEIPIDANGRVAIRAAVRYKEYMAVGVGPRIQLHDLRTGDNMGAWQAHDSDISALTTCRDVLWCLARDGNVTTWTEDDGCIEQTSSFPDLINTGVTLHVPKANTSIVCAGSYKKICVFDAEMMTAVQELDRGHTDKVSALASNSEFLYSGCLGGMVLQCSLAKQ